MITNPKTKVIGTPEIIPYLGYASFERFIIKGRVQLSQDIFRGYSTNQWRNILDTFRRFKSSEIPDSPVELSFNGNHFHTVTDREGYFRFEEDFAAPLLEQTLEWNPVELKLMDSKETDLNPMKGEILYPNINANFGIISDVDDTVLNSHMGSWLKLRMLYDTFVKDGFQRKPMEGMVHILRNMTKIESNHPTNPIFYVSNSPWNLYDMLQEFMDFHQLPKGPILLRDFGIRPVANFFGHKMKTITHIFNLYPDLSFVLFGDTASKDADYYLGLTKQFSNRIKAIYIRYTDDTRNARRVEKLIRQAANPNILVIRNSNEIIDHAQTIGLIE